MQIKRAISKTVHVASLFCIFTYLPIVVYEQIHSRTG